MRSNLRFTEGLLVPLAFLIILPAPASNASTIFSVSGTNTFAGVQSGAELRDTGIPQVFGATFSTTASYSNIDIFVTLVDFFVPVESTVDLDVFLTNKIGTGTTVANQIATATPQVQVVHSDSVTPYTLSEVSILSLPFLAPGTYDLTLSATAVSPASFTLYAGTTDAERTVVTDTGVTVDSRLFGVAPLKPYWPASDFVFFTDSNAWIRMTGDSTVTVTPEPSTMLLMSLAGVALVVGAWRRKRPRAPNRGA